MTDFGLIKKQRSRLFSRVGGQKTGAVDKPALEDAECDRGMTVARFPQKGSADRDQRDRAASGDNQGLLDWNLVTDRIYFSPRWISMLGCSEHQVGNTPDEWLRRVHPDDVALLKLTIDGHLAGGSPEFVNQHRMLHRDGTYRWMAFRGTVSRNEKGQSTRLAGSHADITAEMVADALTGLPNRLLFVDRLTRSVERARQRDFRFAVFVVDLDRFDSLNESLGRGAGDQLLIAVARRLETCLRGDTAAHLGPDHVIARIRGDEFAVLLDSLSEIGEARIIAERLLTEISAPFTVGGHEAYITASIGIALSASGYRQPGEVLRDADIAVHRAKTLGGARSEVFDTAILGSAEAQTQLEKDLQVAMSRHEFVVHYQPIISLPSKRIAGFEALVRWNHPLRGLVPPLEFIPIAERTGLIAPLGLWVLREACRQLKEWQKDMKTGELWMSVNLSSVHFRQLSLAEQIEESLKNAGIEPGGLILELTETAVMDNPEAALAILMKLRVMGARIALDDFGAGYSSLTYLRRLPVDFLKIDRCFTRKMGAGQDYAEIVRSMADLAHRLGLQVIAEGIEDAGQLELIESLDCEYGQGFLFSRPVDAEEASALLSSGLPSTQQAPAGKLENKDAEECGEEIGSLVASVALPGPAGDPSEELGLPPKAGTSIWRSAGLLCGLAVLTLVLMAGILGRLKYDSRSGSSGSGVQVETKTAQAPAPVNEPIATVPLEVAATPTPVVSNPANTLPNKEAAEAVVKKTVKVGPLALVPQAPTPASAWIKDPGLLASAPIKDLRPHAPALIRVPGPLASQPASQSFPVTHLHVMGSCKGTLNIIPGSISYVPEKGKDGFTLKNDEFACDLSGDRLVIKSGSKTYRFKPTASRDQRDNQAQLMKIVHAVSDIHPDTSSKTK